MRVDCRSIFDEQTIQCLCRTLIGIDDDAPLDRIGTENVEHFCTHHMTVENFLALIPTSNSELGLALEIFAVIYEEERR